MNANLEFSKDATTNVSDPFPILGRALNYRSLAMSEPLVIRCRENGPLLIQGAVKIMDHQGNEFVAPAGKDTIALCRCGQSKNRPFCDGSHKTCGFQAAELALPKES
jgi:CDGSH-type Zn-finger protein